MLILVFAEDGNMVKYHIIHYFRLIFALACFLSAFSIQASDHNPILFIHGWSQNASNWTTIKDKLLQDGWKSDLLFAKTFSNITNLSNGANEKNAQEIAAWADEILANTGSQKIDLISHSMGGLSTRYYVKFLGGDKKVNCYISLASPHHGSTVAILAGDMSPNSPLLKKLNDGDETPGGVLPDTGGGHVPGPIRWYSFRSNTDELIKPPETVILDGAENRRRDIGHGEFLTDQTIYEWIREALSPPTPIIQTVSDNLSGVSKISITACSHALLHKTTIEFTVPHACEILVTVVSASGRTIASLQEGNTAAGTHRILWNGTDRAGKSVPAGIYCVSLLCPHGITVHRFALVR